MKLSAAAICLMSFSGLVLGQGASHPGAGQRPRLTVIPPPSAKAQRTATMSNLKQIGIATMILTSDYNDLYPYVQNSSQLFTYLTVYTKNAKLFKSLNPAGGEIQFNMCLAGASLTSLERPAETPMFYEMKTWPDGSRAVAFTDTHVKFVSKGEWSKMQPLLKLKLKHYGKPIPTSAKTLPAPPKVK